MRISDWSSDVCSSDLPPGRAISALGIVGEHRCIQTEYRIIGDSQSLLFAISGNNADDRAKYFLSSDRHTVIDIGENSGLDEESPVHMGRAPPTRGQHRTFRPAFDDIALHTVPREHHPQPSHSYFLIDWFPDTVGRKG